MIVWFVSSSDLCRPQQLFPDLNKIVFLEDDIVVRRDISSLWELDLNGKVSGSVFKSWCGDSCCPGSKYMNYLNFSHPLISSNFDGDQCVWLNGINIFDLEAWRRTNITETYRHWLKQVSVYWYTVLMKLATPFCYNICFGEFPYASRWN